LLCKMLKGVLRPSLSPGKKMFKRTSILKTNGCLNPSNGLVIDLMR